MKDRCIFVFGSNRAGIHGAGAAKEAYQHWGAKWGVGEGLQGSSYALPTKDHGIQTLGLNDIQDHVDDFEWFAREHTDLHFFVTRVGCGLAGYTDADIAPLFRNAAKLPNVTICETWRKLLLP